MADWSDILIDELIELGGGVGLEWFNAIYGWLMKYLGNQKPPWMLVVYDKPSENVTGASGQTGATAGAQAAGGVAGAAPTSSMLNYQPVIGQYPLENISWSRSNNIVEIGHFNDVTRIQNLGQGAATVTFTARWDAVDRDDDLLRIREHIRLLDSFDPVLGRKPILELVTNQESFLCQIVSVSFRYGWPFPGTDKPTWLECSFNLKEWQERPKDVPMFDQTEKSTSYHALRGGECIEELARKYYGDPNYGHALRVINPTIIEEQPGDIVKILPKNHSKIKASYDLVAPIFTDETYLDFLEEIAIARESLGESYEWHVARMSDA